MAVLATVLSHARRIVGDASGIRPRVLVERRFQQQHAVGPLDPSQAPVHGGERALVVAGAGIGGPSRRHRIGDADRLSVVSEIERVVIAEPADIERLALRGERFLATSSESLVALEFAPAQ